MFVFGGCADGNSEHCNIHISGSAAATIQFNDFKTESCCDKLVIGSHSYSGSNKPSGVGTVNSQTTITWTTDNSVVNTGWDMCFLVQKADIPMPALASEQLQHRQLQVPTLPTAVFQVHSGDCTTTDSE